MIPALFDPSFYHIDNRFIPADFEYYDFAIFCTTHSADANEFSFDILMYSWFKIISNRTIEYNIPKDFQ